MRIFHIITHFDIGGDSTNIGLTLITIKKPIMQIFLLELILLGFGLLKMIRVLS